MCIYRVAIVDFGDSERQGTAVTVTLAVKTLTRASGSFFSIPSNPAERLSARIHRLLVALSRFHNLL